MKCTLKHDMRQKDMSLDVVSDNGCYVKGELAVQVPIIGSIDVDIATRLPMEALDVCEVHGEACESGRCLMNRMSTKRGHKNTPPEAAKGGRIGWNGTGWVNETLTPYSVLHPNCNHSKFTSCVYCYNRFPDLKNSPKENSAKDGDTKISEL